MWKLSRLGQSQVWRLSREGLALTQTKICIVEQIQEASSIILAHLKMQLPLLRVLKPGWIEATSYPGLRSLCSLTRGLNSVAGPRLVDADIVVESKGV
jgi:hypothetical protein